MIENELNDYEEENLQSAAYTFEIYDTPCDILSKKTEFDNFNIVWIPVSTAIVTFVYLAVLVPGIYP